MQYLSQPRFYNFNLEDVGRIVLFKCKKTASLLPYMIVFNCHQKDDFDDQILFKDIIAEQNGNTILHPLGYLVGVLDLDYVEILDEPVDKPAGELYTRSDDMGLGVLSVVMQDDGDVCLGLHNTETDPKYFKSLSVEFCTIGSGGGRSPHTLKALQNLVLAISKDNEG